MVKSLVSAAILSFILISCDSTATREEAMALKDSLSSINFTNQLTVQIFIDGATIVITAVQSDPNADIDFHQYVRLLGLAQKSNDATLAKLEAIKEIDEKINYRNSYNEYLIACHGALNEFVNWFDVLQNSRKPETINDINAILFEKLELMKAKELIYRKAIEDFNEKYDLE
ncbi:MAG: hypothetical protein IIA45_03605 [Bacteroidetes bacterium]|nr:hypothetical protein [Bacteroidota bacterium]